MKRITALILTALLTLSVLPLNIVKAEQINMEETNSAPYGTGENSEWAEYSSYYFYNQFNTDERKFYDTLMERSMVYLTGGEDIPESEHPCLPGIPYGNLSPKRADEIFFNFHFQNPQFYFYQGSRSDQSGKVCPEIYKAFCKKSERQMATQQLKDRLDEINNKISTAPSEYDKVKLIHDTICDSVTYDMGIIDNPDHEREFLCQSAYSALVLGSSVCAGYAKTFLMLCSKQGIDCIYDYSIDHAYNRVAVDDVWYMVDCTWDDDMSSDSDINYNYFLRSNEMVQQMDPDNHHVPDSFLPPYLPPCSIDCPPSNNGFTAGKPAEVKETANAPKLTYENGKFTLTAEGADKIYYTIDERTPEICQDQSFVYSSPVSAKEGTVVKAIAVEDPKHKSKVKTWTLGEITPEPTAISVTPSEIEITIGESAPLTATVTPTEETFDIEWHSSDESIVTVKDGVITGISAGKATITAICEELSATAEVTVKEPEPEADAIIKVGKKTTLKAEKKIKKVVVSDKTIAKAVKKGKNVIVKGKNAGIVTVTAYDKKGEEVGRWIVKVE